MKCVFTIATLAAVAAAQSSTSSSASSSTSSSRSSSITSNASNLPFPSPEIMSTTFKNEDAAEKFESKLLSELSTWQTSVTAQKEYSSFLSAVSAVDPSAVKSGGLTIETGAGLLDNIGQQTAAPSWWSKINTAEQAYFTSIDAQAQSIVSKAVQGAAAPTPAPVMQAGAFAAAGALAGAALLL